MKSKTEISMDFGSVISHFLIYVMILIIGLFIGYFLGYETEKDDIIKLCQMIIDVNFQN